MGRTHRAATGGRARRVATVAMALALAASACGLAGPPGAGGRGGERGGGPPLAQGPVAPLGSEGRWLTDARGRVVLLHGVNEVAKSAPYHPAAFGFGADDAAFLADLGFDAVRLGVDFRGLMPGPGEIRTDYIEQLAVTVDALAAEGVLTVLDFHQDGFAPKYNGNGLPDWMAIDDGLPNPPDAVFPLYYVQNPAMQRAFESFWANRAGPDGVGVQDHYVAGLRTVAERFARDPHVIGYELMNEPWPGADWQPCLSDAAGCAALEQERLAPFHRKATTAIHEVAPRQQVWVEPFVLFNFGQVPTSLPGEGTGNELAFHSYAVDVAGEEAVVAHAVDAAERDGAAVVATEFGATENPETLRRLVGQLDGALVPWMFWAYNENIVSDRSVPAGMDAVDSEAAVRELARPHAVAVAGTPEAMSFDPDSGVFDLTYGTVSPDGRPAGPALPTVVAVPELQYPDGYSVEVTGGRVVSSPCADRLAVRADPHADRVTVHVTRGGTC